MDRRTEGGKGGSGCVVLLCQHGNKGGEISTVDGCVYSYTYKASSYNI